MINLKQSLIRSSTFRTSDVEEFERQTKSMFGAVELDFIERPNLDLYVTSVQCHELTLGFWRLGTPTKIKFLESSIVVLGLTVKGRGLITSGTQTAASVAEHPTIASPYRRLELYYNDDLEKIYIGFRPASLERKLASLLGAPANRKLVFSLTDFTSPEMLIGLLDLVRMFIHHVNSPESLISPLALRELENAMTVQLLFSGCHKWSEQLLRKPLDPAPDVIARAEQFIEANWFRPITMESLSELTGVSGRALYRSFAKARGYSPAIFARKIRLERARAFLSRPNADTTVIGTSLACGFLNPGRFAYHYKNMFGELPSQTLQASMGRPRLSEGANL